MTLARGLLQRLTDWPVWPEAGGPSQSESQLPLKAGFDALLKTASASTLSGLDSLISSSARPDFPVFAHRDGRPVSPW